MSREPHSCITTLSIGDDNYRYFSLAQAEREGAGDLSRLPYSLKCLAENLLRHESPNSGGRAALGALGQWCDAPRAGREVGYRPARVLMPEISGLPLLIDLCAMRDAMAAAGGDPAMINPQVPVDIIVDHSVMVDFAGKADAMERNTALEMERNAERYRFLKWASTAFDRLRLVPPGNGILHQVNIERLATVVTTVPGNHADEDALLHLDCLVGMDSHTPMVNALGIMGWGVGGIEAGAALLGEPVSLRIPEVVGVRLLGRLRPEVTATDLVLTLAERLRAHGVVQKFVEYCGSGLDHLTVPERATLSNMAPEFGATMAFVPVDVQTLRYLEATGRDAAQVARVAAYTRAQGMWRESGAPEPVFSSMVEIHLGTIEPSMAGPFAPNQRVALDGVPMRFADAAADRGWPRAPDAGTTGEASGREEPAVHGGIVALAAITSCTNTSNPAVMLAAGLLARNARARGLTAKPWVKASLAPGSRVVADYLRAAGLQAPLDELGFNIVGFGCTTCMGNSGDLLPAVADAVNREDLAAVAVLSGNRNFEGRVHPQCKAAFLASPALVVAYAIAGTVTVDLTSEALGQDGDNQPVFLHDIWPLRAEVDAVASRHLRPALFASAYNESGNFGSGDARWRALGHELDVIAGDRHEWDPKSDYLVRPPYFEGLSAERREGTPSGPVIQRARPLLQVGDGVTTDHISPAGHIAPDGAAGRYLRELGVTPADFNNFAARRANHEVMVRGTFSNPRLRNELAAGNSGGSNGMTRHLPSGDRMTVFDAAARYREEGTPLIVVAGREYGTGSSRDWAAKGAALLGVRALLAESIERIHRSNLIGMGILPLQFPEGVNRLTLGLDGSESFSLDDLGAALRPAASLPMTIDRANGDTIRIEVLCRLDTQAEIDYYAHGGMLPFVLRKALHEPRPEGGAA